MTCTTRSPKNRIRRRAKKNHPRPSAPLAAAIAASVSIFVIVAVLSPRCCCCLARPASSGAAAAVRLSSATRRSRNGNGGGGSSSSSGGGVSVRTTLTFRRPTPETGRRIFRRADDGGGELRFNHDSVGLTNPCLHVAVPTGASASAFAVETTSASRSSSMDGDDDPSDGWWFPPPAAVSEGSGDAAAESGDGEWRVLRYRRRVGAGELCYAAVRDAALEWEFQTSAAPDNEDGRSNGAGGGSSSMGILKVPRGRSSSSSSPSREGLFLWRPRSSSSARTAGCQIYDNVPYWNDCAGLAEPLTGPTAKNVMQIWPGGSSSRPTGRRLITYSETALGGGRFKLRLPSLYAANPVAVVYDLVDQSGPDGGMYTSTAYATLKGHLLSGEERVTVAFRNGGEGGHLSLSKTGAAAHLLNVGSGGGGSEGYVDVEILSYSRAAPTVLGRLAWPLVGRMQDRFFRRQLDALERAARDGMQEGAEGSSSRRSPGLWNDMNLQ